MRVTVQIILLTRGPQNHEKLRFSHTKTMSFARGKTRFLMGHVGPPGSPVSWSVRVLEDQIVGRRQRGPPRSANLRIPVTVLGASRCLCTIFFIHLQTC